MDQIKIVIYQALVRLFGNKKTDMILNGNRNVNGCGKLNDFTDNCLRELRKLGVTHMWYTGIIEHAIVQGYPECNIGNGNPMIIKGKAGSPYAINDYFDVNPDLAENASKRMDEFESLIQRTHQHEMKVLIDFVPNHLARIYYSDNKPDDCVDFGSTDDTSRAFDPANNFYYIDESLILPKELTEAFPGIHYQEFPAKVTGNDKFSAHIEISDWYETVKLNYGIDYFDQKKKHFSPIPDTWVKMEGVLKFWAAKGVDGFRCDMAEMVPVEFWNWVIHKVKMEFPHIIFIAEIYNPDAYSNYIHFGGFDYLYDKVGCYDTLRAIIEGKKSTDEITHCLESLSKFEGCLLRFLENHDEQRIASDYFAGNPWKAISGMVLASCISTGPVMIYFGQETGEPAQRSSGYSGNDGRSTLFDYWNVPEHQKWMNNGLFDGGLLSEDQKQLRKYYQRLLNFINHQEAIQRGKFYNIMWYNQDRNLVNPDKIFAFLRYTENNCLLVICSFSDTLENMIIKIPEHALLTMENKCLEFTSSGIFNCNDTINISRNTLIHEGMGIQINPWDSKIYEIRKS